MISFEKLNNITQIYNNGGRIVVYKHAFSEQLDIKSEKIKSWLEAYKNHPLIKRILGLNGGDKICHTTWKALYEEYSLFLEQEKLENSILTYQYFCSIRKEHSPKLGVATANQLGSCDYCIASQNSIQTLVNTQQKKMKIEEFHKHLELVAHERRTYFSQRYYAKYNKDKYGKLFNIQR